MDEAGGDARELLPARRPESSFFLGGVLIARSLDGSAEDFAELRRVPEQPRAREVHHGEEFPEGILDGRAREQHPPVASKPTERGDGLRVSPNVLQPVRLVTHEQIDAPRAARDDVRVRAKRLERRDEDGPPLLTRQRPILERALRLFIPALHHQRLQPRGAQPLLDLRRPVTHQRRGARDDRLSHRGHARGSLLEQRPQQRHHLQRLPGAHVVRQQTPLVRRARVHAPSKTHRRLVHELDAFALVRTKEGAEKRIHRDGRDGDAARERVPSDESVAAAADRSNGAPNGDAAGVPPRVPSPSPWSSWA